MLMAGTGVQGEYLAENWRMCPLVRGPGHTGAGCVANGNQYPLLILSSENGWVEVGCDYGPNGYSIQDFKFHNIDSNPLAVNRLLYDGLAKFGRDQVVLVHDNGVRLFDRASGEVLLKLDISIHDDCAWIEDYDRDSDPDLFIGMSTRVEVYDLDTGQMLDEIAGDFEDIVVLQADDDPQYELVGIGIFNGSGMVIDLETHEVQWNYEDSFGHFLTFADVDNDGMDELFISTETDGIRVFDLDAQSVKWEQYAPVHDLLLADTNGDGSLELIAAPDYSGGLSCYNALTGEFMWQQEDYYHWHPRLLYAADLDLDGQMELLYSRTDHFTLGDMRVMDLSTQQIEWKSRSGSRQVNAFGVADLDGIDGNELIICQSGYLDEETEAIFMDIRDAATHRMKWSTVFADFASPKMVIPVDADGASPGVEMAIVGDYLVVMNPVSGQILWQAEELVPYAIVADITGDGRQEIIASGRGDGAYDDHIIVFNAADGSKIWESQTFDRTIGFIEVRDIDLDGIREICLHDRGNIIILNGMAYEPEWQTSANGKSLIDVDDLIPDIPGIEIIVPFYSDTFDIYNGITRELITTITLDFGSDYPGFMQAADVDGDGTKELLFTCETRLVCCDLKGNFIFETPLPAEQFAHESKPVHCGDINDDGVNEVLVATVSGFMEYRHGEANPPYVPPCDATGVSLELSGSMFRAGEAFHLDARVCNATGSLLTGHHVFILLDVYGEYWCLPSWTDIRNGLDSYCTTIPPGGWEFPAIQTFFWPDVAGSADGIMFHGAILDPGMTALVGDMASIPFGWRE